MRHVHFNLSIRSFCVPCRCQKISTPWRNWPYAAFTIFSVLSTTWCGMQRLPAATVRKAASFVPWQLTVQQRASRKKPSNLKWVFSFKVIKALFKACCTIYSTSAYHPDTATHATTSLSPFFSSCKRKPPHTIALITQSERLLLMLLSTQDNFINWPDH